MLALPFPEETVSVFPPALLKAYATQSFLLWSEEELVFVTPFGAPEKLFEDNDVDEGALVPFEIDDADEGILALPEIDDADEGILALPECDDADEGTLAPLESDDVGEVALVSLEDDVADDEEDTAPPFSSYRADCALSNMLI